jgi:hypothetical protein
VSALTDLRADYGDQYAIARIDRKWHAWPSYGADREPLTAATSRKLRALIDAHRQRTAPPSGHSIST